MLKHFINQQGTSDPITRWDQLEFNFFKEFIIVQSYGVYYESISGSGCAFCSPRYPSFPEVVWTFFFF